MSIKKWFKNQIAAISIAFSNVEKSVLNQDGKTIVDNSAQEKNVNQGTLAEALKRGEVTKEVRDLRWRTYKVIREAAKVSLTPSHVDEHGNQFYSVKKNDTTFTSFRNIKVDSVDTYDLEMIFYNPESTLGMVDRLEIMGDEDTISADKYSTTNKGEMPLFIGREYLQRFDIERYTKKLVIRKIDEETKLLEFYVSKYGYEGNPTSMQFVKELRKLMDGTLTKKDFLDIKEVGFVTNNTLGSIDLLLYQYEVTKFDKIIEYDGNYVLKFVATVLINGEDTLKDFVEKDLDEKYDTKAFKNNNTI